MKPAKTKRKMSRLGAIKIIILSAIVSVVCSWMVTFYLSRRHIKEIDKITKDFINEIKKITFDSLEEVNRKLEGKKGE